MCIVALAIDQSRRFPLVIASNRDEYFDRPSARLAWWMPQPAPGMRDAQDEILGGRDLQGGGTWLGLTRNARLALVTNIRADRNAPAADPQAPSRGLIVPLWLTSARPADQRWTQVALSGYAPFNLIAADFSLGECWWATSGRSLPVRVQKGLHGLSNAELDAPWPKVQKIKQRVSTALQAHDELEPLVKDLFAALADREPAADARLPFVDLGLEFERTLSAIFVRTPDGRYGTRCSTLVITERQGRHLVTHVLERTFAAGPGLALLRHVTLRDWPARHPGHGTGTGTGMLTKIESHVQQTDAKRQRLHTPRAPRVSDTSTT